MPDLSHVWSADLSIGPTGDLALASGSVLGQQRVLRRLLTNPGDYIWQLDYGAGLGRFVGQPASVPAIRAVIRSQIFKEAAVARSPEPVIDIQFDAAGTIYVHIRYVDAGSGDTQVLAFPGDRRLKEIVMQLQLQNFTTLMQNMAAAVQGACAQLLDLTVGSALRAVLEANASLALWMQWLILQVLQTTRAGTSSGADLDSWMADFSVVRLPAVAAQGSVTFARFTAGSTALIPAGALVRTLDGSQTFAVQTDTASTAWSGALSGYVVPANSTSLDLPVAAQTAGSAGNVQAGAIGLLVSAIPGVDTVTNAAALQGGQDAEADADLRTRFQNFIDSRARATTIAIGYAIASVQQGLRYAIAENLDINGNTHMGNFVVTVDDGSGAPPASLLGLVAQAVESMRPVGSTYAVLAPVVTEVSVAMTITTTPAAQKSALLGPVQSALLTYIDALPIGASLPLSRLSQVAYGVSTAISNVSAMTINGATLDIVPGGFGVVKAASVIIS